MELETSIEREYEGRKFELWLSIACNYRPARPAPPCSNPDSPAFSDPGDDAELDIRSARVVICLDISDKPNPREWLRAGDKLPPDIELSDDEITGLYEQANEQYADEECDFPESADCSNGDDDY